MNRRQYAPTISSLHRIIIVVLTQGRGLAGATAGPPSVRGGKSQHQRSGDDRYRGRGEQGRQDDQIQAGYGQNPAPPA